ncbi:gliding motility-associated C-terminal domain-containing protein [Arenibacter sp. BSSL-BM3]|uniref:Gliding motility-associated C-terminal domain-containing protein n=1 Tax=Arenibacter arenosicollis TaxID=2762274 RepID=A0ABR7QQA7_9FLAO|nr:gliding motility-associated C-terminal domain-containing protein [Arenibacter arenosicollis]MBC8769381.1 gliding motility-associated C-terminal domain-containing protein [Arenibacter arenosicollis]
MKKYILLILFLFNTLLFFSQEIDWSSLSGNMPEAGYVTSSYSAVAADGASLVTVNITQSGSSTTGGAVNAVAPSSVGNSYNFNNERAAIGYSGNTYTYTFSEPVYVTLSSQAHSALMRTENIKLNTTTPGATIKASLVNPLANHFLQGNESANVHLGSIGLNNTTTGTYWLATTSIPVTNLSVEYYTTDASDIAGNEPFTITLDPLPFILLDPTDSTGAGRTNINVPACTTGYEFLEVVNTGISANYVGGRGMASMTVTLLNPQDIGQESLSMSGGFSGLSVSGNGSTSLIMTNTSGSLNAPFVSAVNDLFYKNTSLSPNTEEVREVQITYTDTEGNISASASAFLTLTEGANAGLPISPKYVFTGDPNFDLFTTLDGSQNTGGTWVDVDETGALINPSTINVSALPLGGSTFRYDVVGNGPCSNAFATVVVIKINSSEVPISSNTSCGQVMTEYTNSLYSSNSDDPIFIFSGGSGELSAELGAAGTIFDWYKYNPTTNSYDTYALNSTPTQSGLGDGGYLVVRNDGGTIEEGRAWVWNSNLILEAGTPQTICEGQTVTLNGSGTVSNPTFTYYDPVVVPLIIDSSTQITVTFDATHTYVSDLGFYMVSPDGSTTIELGVNQGNTCNGGDNVTNLRFTNQAADVFNYCSQPAPLTGLYNQYFDGTTTITIDWSPLYGMNARDGGWAVQIYDCVGADVGSLTGAIISFDNGADGSVTYSSGAISSPINDNSCNPASASKFIVPFNPPVQNSNSSIALNNGVGIGSMGGYEWSYSTNSATGPWSGPFENANLTPDFPINETTWFRIVADNGVGCLFEDVVQVTSQPKSQAGLNDFVSFYVHDTPTDLFTIIDGTPDSGGSWSGPSTLSGGYEGTFNPLTNISGIYTYTVNGTAPCSASTVNVEVFINRSVDSDGDGVTDGQEVTDETDPLDICSYIPANATLEPSTGWNTADCDGDGVTNADETTDGSDSQDPCSYVMESVSAAPSTAWNTEDCDGDGVTNGQEMTDGTNPQDDCSYLTSSISVTVTSTSDCDGDGVTNVDEATDGTDGQDTCSFELDSVSEAPSTAWENEDCDGDGVTNGQEMSDGTDPKDDCSYLTASISVTVTSTADCDGDGVTNADEATDGTDGQELCSYVMESVSVAQNTAWDGEDCDGDGVTNEQEMSDGTDPKDDCSYLTASISVTVTSTADCDGDGVTNADEATDRTDGWDTCSFELESVTVAPSTAWDTEDCDGDGVTNGQEMSDGTDPKDDCSYLTASISVTVTSTADCDGDGVTNADEATDGTDGRDNCTYALESVSVAPSMAWDTEDCDGDGVTNGQEMSDGTDPKDDCSYVTASISVTVTSTADCDSDGVTNADEATDGTDGQDHCSYALESVSVAPSTAWDTEDCDGDGVTNGQEMADLTNPLDDCSYLTASISVTVTSTADCDGDGVTNDKDKCRNTPVGEATDTNGCSATQRDDDNDGVNDALDQCLQTPNGESVDTNGCSDSQKDGDADGVNDADDTCPNTIIGQTVDASGCSPAQKDSDDDGINDADDTCPESPSGESVDINGCSDSQKDADADGVTNEMDECPNTPIGEDSDANGCSTTQKDTDFDGVDDAKDQCPNSPEDEAVDVNGCSASQKDEDGDGVQDSMDNCPSSFNPGQEDRDNDGFGDVCDTVELNVSQSFTPNGDGINDSWMIYNIENYPNSLVRVFNSWGKEVFSAKNYQNDWDGRYKDLSAKLPSAGSYYFQIDFEGDGKVDQDGWLFITSR